MTVAVKSLGANRYAAALLAISTLAATAEAPIAGQPIVDRQNPPAYRSIDPTELAQISLGRDVFNLQWAAAGKQGAAQGDGVGPFFNATSCEACHNGGGAGIGPAGDGPAPVGLVIKLESPASDGEAQPGGDPIYGSVLSTTGLNGIAGEAIVTVQYREITGYYYPDGIRWRLREPHYRIEGLRYGRLAPTTVIKPRLAPALFGVGLLEAVPETAIDSGTNAGMQVMMPDSGRPAWQQRQGIRKLGRLGWQGDALSIRDQATIAFAHEMGLTSLERPSDDCTPPESDCLNQPNGGTPEVSEELLDALVFYLRTRAVPKSLAHAEDASSGPGLFRQIGCAGCHRPRLPVELVDAHGTKTAVIAPYTDLRLHDLGLDMADEDSSGARIVSRWRTAPLWGLGYRSTMLRQTTLMHDGRARSVEEAILWHLGEAAGARSAFMRLLPRSRKALLHWLDTL